MGVVTGGGGGGAVSRTALVLTDAQIKALPSTPVEIVAAQGAGKMVVPIVAVFSSHTAGGAYTNISVFSTANVFNGAVYLVWDALNNFQDATGPVKAALLLGSTSPHVAFSGMAAGQIIAGIANGGSTSAVLDVGTPDTTANGYTDSALYVVGQNPLGDFTGGDPANTLTVTVFYSVAGV